MLLTPNFLRRKFGGVFRMKFEPTSRNIPRKHYKYRFCPVLTKESRSYPRDVVAGVATKRGPALLLAAKKAVRRAAALKRLRTCSQGGPLLSTPPAAVPGHARAAIGAMRHQRPTKKIISRAHQSLPL